MSTPRATILLCGLLLGAIGPGDRRAEAHGGLPISRGILRAKGAPSTMYVPVYYWGLWVGAPSATDGSLRWRWICEEAVNLKRTRVYAVSQDGATQYATDNKGLTVSSMGGCQWDAATGELATLRTVDLEVDPVDAATAYVATGANAVANGTNPSTPPSNGLFVTHDRGLSFSRLAGIGTSSDIFESVRVSPSDPLVIYASSKHYAPPFDQRLHRSSDGGLSFTTMPIAPLAGRPATSTFEILAVDPRSPEVLYARAGVNLGTGDVHLLLRSLDAGASFTELWHVDIADLYGEDGTGEAVSGINDLAIDLSRDELLIATTAGLVRGSATLAAASPALALVGSLPRVECVDAHEGQTYACSWDQNLDYAAISVGPGGAETLSPFLTFKTDTLGPISCAAGTTVGDICPGIWSSYAYQLGIGAGGADGGTSNGDGGEPPPEEPGCSVAHGRTDTAGPLSIILFALGLLGLRARTRAKAVYLNARTPGRQVQEG